MRTVIAATNKGHRVWIQDTGSKFGWPVGTRYNQTWSDGVITLTRSDTGKRKVSKGKSGIIDLTSQKVTRWAQGAESCIVAVSIDRQSINIIAD